MITKKEALLYEEQLHPAFAGYLHDGSISQRDALASIFQLIKKGTLEPVWEDKNMLRRLIAVRLMQKKPQNKFEDVIVQHVFSGDKEVSAKQIGKFIKGGQLQDIIRNNLHAIEAFPVINNELQFKLGKHGKVNFVLNGRVVDTLEEAAVFKKTLTHIIIPVFSIISIFLIAMYLTLGASVDSSPLAFLLTPVIMMAVAGLMYFLFLTSKKTVDYSFTNHVIPIAKKKYDELFEFMKSYPLPKHRFTNEFLPFSIAFGLDNSWNQDFRIEDEIEIDK